MSSAFVELGKPGGGFATPPRIRRRVDDLSPSELEDFRNAFAEVKARRTGGYAEIAGIHGLPLPMYGQHGSGGFLPWHRAYLVVFESALAEHGWLGLPWWDWAAADPQRRAIPTPFSEPGSRRVQNPLRGATVPASARQDDRPKRTSRSPGKPEDLPTPGDVEAVLSIEDFLDFASALENLHNAMHGWLGGTNGLVTWASYDPIFWSMQANADRIWRMWQLRHPEASVPSDLIPQALPPFRVTVGEVLDTMAIGYDYDLVSDLPSVLVGAAGARSDVASTSGGLGFADYAESFATLIASPMTEPPITIGIYGAWGSGKSSLLKQITNRLDQVRLGTDSGRGRFFTFVRSAFDGTTKSEDSLSDEPKVVHVVPFNAWDYSASELIWPALVRKAMDYLETNAPLPWYEKSWRRLTRNGSRAWKRNKHRVIAAAVAALPLGILAWARLDFSLAQVTAVLGALGVAGVIGLVGTSISHPLSRWLAAMLEDADYGRQTDLMSEIREDLRFLDKRLDERSRMLIIVDDLDRCEPAKSVEVLQAVNLLLNFPSFVVCMGIDARVVTAAIEAHYQGLLEQAGASGYEYLDKIIQIPFQIPEPSPDDLQQFLRQEVTVVSTAKDDEADAEMAELAIADDRVSSESQAYESLVEVRGETTQQGASPADSRPRQETPFTDDELKVFLAIAPFLRPNPRHIKRLINVYRLVRTLLERRGRRPTLTPERRKVLIRWLAISAQWPYTTYAMMSLFHRSNKEEREQLDADGPAAALRLLERAEPMLDVKLRNKIDDNPKQLRAFLADPETAITASDLEILYRYTINFNPAVAELPLIGPGEHEPARRDAAISSRGRDESEQTHQPTPASPPQPLVE